MNGCTGRPDSQFYFLLFYLEAYEPKSSSELIYESHFDVEPVGVENRRNGNRFGASHNPPHEPSRARWFCCKCTRPARVRFDGPGERRGRVKIGASRGRTHADAEPAVGGASVQTDAVRVGG